ncbi:hypothetical protein H6F43_13645 [Leptolyngbya sp. FACHB-36]|uniref:hypothetical protein n=1 Tax=Leptolyngbya sp. FACHB-36 TaxID=2692808 RepID=UPI0016805306|nr:hypothetical protein [Leptolyngbya sp. FACHB-36]MBD2021221.1 hypothetical protein [Leptolyngbya sp. FACHB-36]
MTQLRQIVQAALRAGYLTSESEAAIRHLAELPCTLSDIESLITLQQAVSTGKVARLSQPLAESAVLKR